MTTQQLEWFARFSSDLFDSLVEQQRSAVRQNLQPTYDQIEANEGPEVAEAYLEQYVTGNTLLTHSRRRAIAANLEAIALGLQALAGVYPGSMRCLTLAEAPVQPQGLDSRAVYYGASSHEFPHLFANADVPQLETVGVWCDHYDTAKNRVVLVMRHWQHPERPERIFVMLTRTGRLEVYRLTMRTDDANVVIHYAAGGDPSDLGVNIQDLNVSVHELDGLDHFGHGQTLHLLEYLHTVSPTLHAAAKN